MSGDALSLSSPFAEVLARRIGKHVAEHVAVGGCRAGPGNIHSL
jgi:hypothetical protein